MGSVVLALTLAAVFKAGMATRLRCSFRTWDGSGRSRFSSLALTRYDWLTVAAPSSNASRDLARTGGHL
jgi:hypothetical protein